MKRINHYYFRYHTESLGVLWMLRISFRIFISLNNIEDPQSIENMKAYLCKMATNRSIDKLRSAAHKRNVYVGCGYQSHL